MNISIGDIDFARLWRETGIPRELVIRALNHDSRIANFAESTEVRSQRAAHAAHMQKLERFRVYDYHTDFLRRSREYDEFDRVLWHLTIKKLASFFLYEPVPA